MTTTLATLNDRYALGQTLRFEAGPGGLTVARIANDLAEASVALHGAHVLSYRPAGAAEVLWLSRESVWQDGEPIRGGIPVCWPWFGAHPTDAALPGHGFVRRRAWEVLSTEALASGATRLRLGLSSDKATLANWPHAFELQLTVTVGSNLRVALTMRNPGNKPYTCTAALHTYFAAGDVRQATVHGLDGVRYIDTVGGANTEHIQQGPIAFDAEVDRAYLDTTATCRIDLPALKRQIEVAKGGSRTTVVWNPWIAKAARMPDFGDDEYPEMLCVETANARDDAVAIAPGSEHTTTTIISVS